MDLGISEAIALVVGVGIGSVPYSWALRHWRGHEHVYHTMQSDGRWHCAICGRPKRRGT